MYAAGSVCFGRARELGKCGRARSLAYVSFRKRKQGEEDFGPGCMRKDRKEEKSKRNHEINFGPPLNYGESISVEKLRRIGEAFVQKMGWTNDVRTHTIE